MPSFLPALRAHRKPPRLPYARPLDILRKSLAKTKEYAYRKAVAKATNEPNTGERSDVVQQKVLRPSRKKGTGYKLLVGAAGDKD